MIIATLSSVYKFAGNDSGRKPTKVLEDQEIRRVIEGTKLDIVALADGGLLIVDGDEVDRLNMGIHDRIDSLCLINEIPIELLIGTTPPYLFKVQGNDRQAERVKTFDNLEVRSQWYTPWGGPAAVRSLASTHDGWVYADIHVGSIMRSPDQGKSWAPVTPTLHVDVHQVATSPASDERVYANTYLAVYISYDRGVSWVHRSKDLNNRYGRGIAIHPENPDILLCGVSDGPSGANVHGQLYHTLDAGVTWTHVTKGFPYATRKNIDTFHIAFAGNDIAWVCDEENLYISKDGGEHWELYWKAPEEILMLSCYI
jgi:hypothetical protein